MSAPLHMITILAILKISGLLDPSVQILVALVEITVEFGVKLRLSLLSGKPSTNFAEERDLTTYLDATVESLINEGPPSGAKPSKSPPLAMEGCF